MASARGIQLQTKEEDSAVETSSLPWLTFFTSLLEYIGPILYVTIALCLSIIVFVTAAASRHPVASAETSLTLSLESKELLVAVTASISLTLPIFLDIMLEWYIKNKDHDFLERQIMILAINATNIFLCFGENSTQFTSILFCESLLLTSCETSLLFSVKFSDLSSLFFSK